MCNYKDLKQAGILKNTDGRLQSMFIAVSLSNRFKEYSNQSFQIYIKDSYEKYKCNLILIINHKCFIGLLA